MNFHKILLKFTKIRMDFQLTIFFGDFYMIFSLSVFGAIEVKICFLGSLIQGDCHLSVYISTFCRSIFSEAQASSARMGYGLVSLGRTA
jgi:hypothetical protein